MAGSESLLVLLMIYLKPLNNPVFFMGIFFSFCSLILLIRNWIQTKNKEHFVCVIVSLFIFVFTGFGFIYRNILFKEQREDSKTHLKISGVFGPSNSISSTSWVYENTGDIPIQKLFTEYYVNYYREKGVTIFSFNPEKIYKNNELEFEKSILYQEELVLYAENRSNPKPNESPPNLDWDFRKHWDGNFAEVLEPHGDPVTRNPNFQVFNNYFDAFKGKEKVDQKDNGCVNLTISVCYELENQPGVKIVKPNMQFYTELDNGKLTWKQNYNSRYLCAISHY
jgi:hypothetical protein